MPKEDFDARQRSRSLQRYENHRRIDYLYSLQGLVLIISLACGLAAFFVRESAVILLAAALTLNTLASLVLMIKIRQYPLILQDRIIRLEMQTRLRRVLPEDRHWEINGLTLDQMIGLRFASDGELPDLVRKVLDENITSRDAIKRMVKHWESDELRV
ncbi:MAG TPA: DUF6526 family protein [Candidatus Hydrogenedentes bacterium]|nr:DUF6526 family protein [Candidatus Hydrogenedentota bacterium]